MLILLHHIGASSRVERVTPVACSPQAEGRFAIWAANGGSPAHPAWYYNLKAHPRPRSKWAPRPSRSWRRNWTAPPAPSRRVLASWPGGNGFADLAGNVSRDDAVVAGRIEWPTKESQCCLTV